MLKHFNKFEIWEKLIVCVHATCCTNQAKLCEFEKVLHIQQFCGNTEAKLGVTQLSAIT